eukprot:364465-Chlamydomonas_euryale.AAC.2
MRGCLADHGALAHDVRRAAAAARRQGPASHTLQRTAGVVDRLSARLAACRTARTAYTPCAAPRARLADAGLAVRDPAASFPPTAGAAAAAAPPAALAKFRPAEGAALPSVVSVDRALPRAPPAAGSATGAASAGQAPLAAHVPAAAPVHTQRRCPRCSRPTRPAAAGSLPSQACSRRGG